MASRWATPARVARRSIRTTRFSPAVRHPYILLNSPTSTETSLLSIRLYSSSTSSQPNSTAPKGNTASKKSDEKTSAASGSSARGPSPSTTSESTDTYWEDEPNYDIEKFTELPYTNFGVNQHMIIDREFKEVMRQLLWKFRAPIRYAFAYGSGVFPQSKNNTATEADIRAIHPKAPAAVVKAQTGGPKMIDFIFGVGHTQHWHSLNMRQYPDHYSALGSLGSGAVSHVQDKWGAGVYFHPYITVEGVMIKYGVVNIDTLCRDLSEWDTLYLAGRLHKPVKILRDNPRVRLANQVNLISALRTALLMLPESFTEQQLYATIASISYLGDVRMAFPTEDPRKVANIVNNNMVNFRRLYVPLIESLPNARFMDPRCSNPDWIFDGDATVSLQQDMDPFRRGNMVRRLPKSFRSKLYFEYQKKFQIPQLEFNKMMEESNDDDIGSFKKQQGGGFEQRIAQDSPEELRNTIRGVIKKTIGWPSTSQSIKAILTAGVSRSMRYLGEKMAKYKKGSSSSAEEKKE
ncbi:mitochondrial matrix Mmp37-domain-containing protein [Microdochium trichocladiopsis]|uniref:Phosphatidate cytidylyltransferase, mitochondrial n=1 Tax=Microdochium trichocladiopsis TaxID=1682393 RepID=A0A9P8YAE5_9PEZI|nr:mitochondrial matrix Mmp37-domain-containing protein [Microdochium trichocladiopsis]KAH7031620.1 mitochondrial matrix Mmp37-domain-containing protein [Microdochium trichocladiopsis]